MSEEICDGVKLLCDRMASNPEEFTASEFDVHTMERKQGRYFFEGRTIEALARGEGDAAAKYWYLNQAEKDALIAAYTNMMRVEFTGRVIERLFDAPEEEVQTNRGPLTANQMRTAALTSLNQVFAEEYEKYNAERAKDAAATYTYKATGRYDLGNK